MSRATTTRVKPTSSARTLARMLRAAALVGFVLVLSTMSLRPDAKAMSGGPYDIPWDTIDGGGVTFATGGTFSLGGTIGQPDAGVMSGGTYVLGGGFWQGGYLLAGVGDDLPGTPGDGSQSTHFSFHLYSAVPNPSQSVASISFDLPKAETARLAIFNLVGECVTTLAEGEMAAGRHRVQWDGTDRHGSPAASGVYLMRLESGSSRQEGKIVVLR